MTRLVNEYSAGLSVCGEILLHRQLCWQTQTHLWIVLKKRKSAYSTSSCRQIWIQREFVFISTISRTIKLTRQINKVHHSETENEMRRHYCCLTAQKMTLKKKKKTLITWTVRPFNCPWKTAQLFLTFPTHTPERWQGKTSWVKVHKNNSFNFLVHWSAAKDFHSAKCWCTHSPSGNTFME